MQKSTEQAVEWQEIWDRHNAVDTVIDWGRTAYNFFFRSILRRYLTRHSAMIELGCGRASLSLSLAPEIGSLVGADISDSAVDQANRYAQHKGLRNAAFKVSNCTDLGPEFYERFDFSWSQGLIEHFDDSTAITKEHYKALRPGGVALISVPYRWSYHNVWYTITRPQLLRRFWPWTEQKFFDEKTLLALGKSITPHSRVFLLQPLPLGIVFLEMKKPIA
jgi:SAM-dependent methyltransferase